MSDGIKARDLTEECIRRELFGPINRGEFRGHSVALDGSKVRFSRAELEKRPIHDSETGEEVITHGTPLTRYSVGILHGTRDENLNSIEEETINLAGEESGAAPEEFCKSERKSKKSSQTLEAAYDEEEFDLTAANKRRPSSMGLTFKLDLEVANRLTTVFRGAYYEATQVNVEGQQHPETWWVRRPFTVEGQIVIQSGGSRGKPGQSVKLRYTDGKESPNLDLKAQCFIREIPGYTNESQVIVSVVVRNVSKRDDGAHAVFQSRLSVFAEDRSAFLPYDANAVRGQADELEVQTLRLLYRNRQTYAIGHGCSADWNRSQNPTVLTGEVLPTYEVESLSADVYFINSSGEREELAISMGGLANFESKACSQVDVLLDQYEQWIHKKEEEVELLEPGYHSAAYSNLNKCKKALGRMKQGWGLVKEDELARTAFCLANRAMNAQRLRSKIPLRKATISDRNVTFATGPSEQNETAGTWRPFQIGFLLATIPDVLKTPRPERLNQDNDIVDLIFFPTGGGKTEAYLGVAAFSLLSRRLMDKNDAGTDIIMRYTLRLLTTQQFLRAASLICVLDDIRSKNEKLLGDLRITIGVWLGSSVTPNTWKQARRNLSDLRKNRSASSNLFLLNRCPWCGAQMGVVASKYKRTCLGYRETDDGARTEFFCPDKACRFSNDPLPIKVVDEDLYQDPPSLVIATVDKFALLAWNPAARALFGMQGNERRFSPPSLIIQDEFHLISGPLGSMVGLYETVVQDLCKVEHEGKTYYPKIICSTATIRRYKRQVRDVFGRIDSEVELFPPQGLEEGSSFFAETALDEDGNPAPGRKYLGVYSGSLSSMQSLQVRVASASLQAGQKLLEKGLDCKAVDGYWTNLNFFNSLRELGNTVSLIESDVRDYLQGIRRRDGSSVRWPENVMELTSRKQSDEIPKALDELSVGYRAKEAIDICLASNIIEVGVDVDRLALMTIVGQPKTVGQYIQVSGRVGRNPGNAPGLVLTLYGSSKPRDRSHYEKFRTFHQSLYAQVEPTSVTPFSRSVLKRALHAVLISIIRQRFDFDIQPSEFPEKEFQYAVGVFRDRVREQARAARMDDLLDSSIEDRLMESVREIEGLWKAWDKTDWEKQPEDEFHDDALLRRAGSYIDSQYVNESWETPTSMRAVDAECQLKIERCLEEA